MAGAQRAAADILTPISEREFNIYALSLPHGPNYDPLELVSAWKTYRSGAVGAVLADRLSGTYAALVLRRRIDHRFVVVTDAEGFGTETDALAALAAAMPPDCSPLPLAPGEKRRPPLFDIGDRTPGAFFEILTTQPSHIPAMVAIGEVYLSMPRPDDNFVSDFQTENLNARLWELYLLAAFREQGIAVTQPYSSPDFHLEHLGHECWVEAVTANPSGERIQGFAPPVHAPTDRTDRLIGAPAERFAKTLRSKLQREYETAPHVQGKPLALAIADYHAPSSMVWSREALPSYLYGSYAKVEERPGGPVAVSEAISTLQGPQAIPAGLFRDPSMAHLSAIIFSNAATFGKFNRMGFLAGWRPPGLTMIREGDIFDRTPGALKPKLFTHDILSDAYQSLWPGGEAWCQELEVFHNPLAEHPIPFDLIPGATHWFEQDGEVLCSSFWECSILSSVTQLKFER